MTIRSLNSCFDLVDLRLLLNIDETGSLTGAAERSHMSLPAASTRIRDIEDGFSIRLLHRNSQGVVLTEAGNTFLHHGRLILQQVDRLSGDLQEFAQGVKGQIGIFADTTAIESVSGLLATYLSAHPDVNIELRECLSKDIAIAVSEGKTDIGIVDEKVSTTGLEVLPYREGRLVLATPNTHHLAERTGIHFTEALDFQFITLTKGTPLQRFLKDAANRMNRNLKIRIEVTNFDTLCQMIESGVGIGVIPESAARNYCGSRRIKIIPVIDDWAVQNQQICVRDFDLLPKFAKELVEILAADKIDSPGKNVPIQRAEPHAENRINRRRAFSSSPYRRRRSISER